MKIHQICFYGLREQNHVQSFAVDHFDWLNLLNILVTRKKVFSKIYSEHEFLMWMHPMTSIIDK